MRLLKLLAISVAAFFVLAAGLILLVIVIEPKPKPPAQLVQTAVMLPSLPAERQATATPPVSPVAAISSERQRAKQPLLRTTTSSLRAWFEKLGVEFRAAPLADGTPRLLGQHPDQMTMVELIGQGDALESASLTYIAPKDNIEVLTRNTGALMVFMRETGWDGGEKWAIPAMSQEKTTKVHGAVVYELLALRALSGVCVLTAKPVGAK